MKRRFSKHLARLVMLSGMVLLFVTPALSDSGAADDDTKVNASVAAEVAAKEQEARYRLRADGSSVDSRSQEELLQRFEWGQIAGNGPASGSVPVIGANSGKSYVDFRDGLDAPETH